MEQMEQIRKLVGNVNKEQLRHIDCFVSEQVGLFMPVSGPCFYALTPEHTHPSYMFILPFSDQTTVVGNRSVVARQGMFQAVSPDIPHHEVFSEACSRYIAIMIEPEFFMQHLSAYSINQAPVLLGTEYPVSLNLLPKLKEFMIEADNRLPGAKAVLDAISIEICHCIIRNIYRMDAKRDRITNRIEIDKVIEFLYSNISRRITLDEMAGIANMSASHFARLFREETGKPPIEYLNQIRIDRAKKLLLESDRTITQIAIECGFNSSSYLSSSFYKQLKISPSEFRKNLKK
ncbi:MAG: AraC family transcriptional regulator [Clostridia bacterium]|nr:AraC family transcriptional regulator [Clostridia bacterium]